MYYLSKRWFILMIAALVGSVGISGYQCGYTLGNQRSYEAYENVRAYAILLEEQNSYLNKKLKGLKKCQVSNEN